MNHLLARQPSVGVAVAAALLAVALSSRPASCGPSHIICPDCIPAANDTSFTPGIVSIARFNLSPAFEPHVAFIGTDNHLRCAVPTTPGWQVQVVDPLADAVGCSMDLDDAGEPIISYHDAAGFLWWAHRVGPDWMPEPVGTAVGAVRGVFGSTSIGHVPGGGVGIAYVSAGVLRYAESIGGAPWSVEMVAQTGGAEAYPSLVVDEATHAIAYYHVHNGDLMLAQRVVGGAAWTSALIDSGGNVGGYASLVGSATFGFGIAYYDFTNEDLRYAYDSPIGWQIQVPEGAGVSVGRFCSATAFTGTPEDIVGIAYYDQTNGDLRYALRRGPVWNTGVLDDAGDTGAYVSAGRPAGPMSDSVGIAYVNRDTGDLYYRFDAGTVNAVPGPAPAGAALRVEWLRAGGGGRVRFVVPIEGVVRVAFYDATGRVTNVALHQRLPAGAAEVRWDGRDHRGRPVPSGMYFVRVETAAGAATAPALVLR